MPENLTGVLIDTGIMYQDVVDNIHQLILEHLPDLVCRDGQDDQLEDMVVKYDELKVFHTPFISIVWDSARVVTNRINNCMTFANDVTIYHYLESLSFGNDTHPFLEPMYRLMEMFYVHWNLYGLTAGTANNVEIANSSLIGRRLDSDVFLTHQLNLIVNVKKCRGCHA